MNGDDRICGGGGPGAVPGDRPAIRGLSEMWYNLEEGGRPVALSYSAFMTRTTGEGRGEGANPSQWPIR